MIFVLKVADEFYKSIGGKKAESVKIIVSSHNLESTPSVEEIGNLAARIQATGADVVKIATTALDITDCARLFQVLVHSQVIHLLISKNQHQSVANSCVFILH